MEAVWNGSSDLSFFSFPALLMDLLSPWSHLIMLTPCPWNHLIMLMVSRSYLIKLSPEVGSAPRKPTPDVLLMFAIIGRSTLVKEEDHRRRTPCLPQKPTLNHASWVKRKGKLTHATESFPCIFEHQQKKLTQFSIQIKPGYQLVPHISQRSFLYSSGGWRHLGRNQVGKPTEQAPSQRIGVWKGRERERSKEKEVK